MKNTITSYTFKEKEEASIQLNSIGLNGEMAIDYIISIWDFHNKTTVNLYSALLQSVLGRKYNKAIAILISSNILKKVSKPIDGVISTGYQLNILKKVEQENKENKYLDTLLDSTKKYKNKGLSKSRQAMVGRYNEWFKDAHISISNEEIEALSPEDKKKVSNFNNHVPYTKFDDYGGRFYTNVVSLPKELREKIKIDGEETVEIDICTSHVQKLYHLSHIFNLDDNFKRTVEKGDVYKLVAYKLGVNRSVAKSTLNIALNCKEGGYRNKMVVALFPKLFKEIDRLKFFYGHKIISRILQKSEMLDITAISEDLAFIGIKHFTIHDSFLIKKSDINIVRGIMLEHNYKTKIK